MLFHSPVYDIRKGSSVKHLSTLHVLLQLQLPVHTVHVKIVIKVSVRSASHPIIPLTWLRCSGKVQHEGDQRVIHLATIFRKRSLLE